MVSAYIWGLRSHVRTVSSSYIRASTFEADDGVFGLFERREVRRVDLIEAAAEPRQGADVPVDGGPAQILEQVVMEVDAVEARLAGENLLQIREVIVDKVRERLRWVHEQ